MTTGQGELNPLAGHPAAVFLRIVVGQILDPPRFSWRDPEPEPLDEKGLESLRREMEISLDRVTDRLRRIRLAAT